jgi:acetyl esterase/lipase
MPSLSRVLHRILIGVVTLALSMTASAQARVEKNVVYGVFSGTALLMDVHHPARPNGFGIVHIAGSGWYTSIAYSAPALKDRLEVFAPALVAAGYTVFTISHRASPRFSYPAPVEDAQRAVRFVRHNAAKYGIDPRRMGGAGGSSGAHLVSLLGTMEGAGDPNDPDPVNRESAKLQSIVTRAAPIDLLQMSPSDAGDAVALFLGMRIMSQPPDIKSVERYASYKTAAAASPINYVSANAAPFLLIHGDADLSVPLRQSELMEGALKKAGVPVKLIRIPGGNHALATPGARISPEHDEEIVQWLDVHLRKSATPR